jgi:hypothetical protein
MRPSSDHILTSHAGSLPRPDDLIAAWGHAADEATDEYAFAQKLRAAVFMCGDKASNREVVATTLCAPSFPTASVDGDAACLI